MAESPANPTGTYGEGVKWILAIAAAAIGGAFLHLKEIEEQNSGTQALLALALVLFVFSIWSGMYYLLWLNLVPVAWERRRLNDENLKALEADSSKRGDKEAEEHRSELKKDIAKDDRIIKQADPAKQDWHKYYTYSFSAALTCATVGLLLSIILHIAAPKADDKKSPNESGSIVNVHSGEGKPRFSIVFSAVHTIANGRHEAHTFLIKNDTGDLWQMICDAGEHVAFRRVQVENLSGGEVTQGAALPSTSPKIRPKE